jgi:hypothetical protein
MDMCKIMDTISILPRSTAVQISSVKINLILQSSDLIYQLVCKKNLFSCGICIVTDGY